MLSQNMNIVNITNSYQGYTNFAISTSFLDFQIIILGFGLLTFILSFTFSIILMIKENSTAARLPAVRQTLSMGPVVNSWTQKLFSAFSELETAKSWILNLDDLKVNNIVGEDSYEKNLQEYELQKTVANDKISSAKLEIEKELNSRIESRSRVEKSLEEFKRDNIGDDINKSRLRSKEKRYKQEIESLNREISVLQSLINASGTYDIIAIEK